MHDHAEQCLGHVQYQTQYRVDGRHEISVAVSVSTERLGRDAINDEVSLIVIDMAVRLLDWHRGVQYGPNLFVGGWAL